MRSVGIDSGAQGCICLLDSEQKTAKYLYLPYRRDKILDGNQIDIAFECFHNVDRITVEKVCGRGGWGAAQNFGFGKNFGMLLHYLSPYPFHLIAPTCWQTNPHKYAQGETSKEKSYFQFTRLNPSFGKLTKSNSGLVDSFFIARYGLECLRAKFTDDWSFFDLR